ncbi:MAG: hypothetical protein MUO50_08310, partial [Longimicrobiales bacterium]|nr:hypothetical protein [Longimicrobiales bacterium]
MRLVVPQFLRPALVFMASQAADPNGDGGFVTSEGGRGLSADEREFLRRVALDSILFGLEKGRALEPELDAAPLALRAPGAAFVTLNLRG